MVKREQIPIRGQAARASLSIYGQDLGAGVFIDLLANLSRTSCGDSEIHPNARVDDAPTWKALTESTRIAQRIAQQARALAKRTAIDVALAMPWRKRAPCGHRILVYHLVLREDRERFEEHIRFLRDHYRLVTARELAGGVGQANERAMASITFDDGFRVLMSDTLELLERHGVKATFFVPTGFIELASNWSLAAAYSLRAHHYQRPLEPMTVDDLRELVRLGHEVGSHGVSHLGLKALSHKLAAIELESSRARLATWLGDPPDGFAYPYGELDSSLGKPPDWVSAAGYKYAVTMRRGALHAGSDTMQLPREHVEGSWRVRDLRYFLSY